MSYRFRQGNRYKDYFVTFNKISVPDPLQVLARILFISILLLVLVLTITPWVQTSYGTGRVSALNPEDRVQAINAPVAGRIAQWFVRDGMQVKKGDPLVEIVDNDPNLVTRLEAERDAIMNKLQSMQRAALTAEIDFKRQKELFEEGLSSRKEKEVALIKFEDLQSKVAAVEAELNTAEVKLSRQTTQLVLAPRDGTILSINAGDLATFVKKGDILGNFLPNNVQPIVELYVTGLDAPLVYPGREVRLIFEGWPAVQFSGWPSRAIGTFHGVVQAVDPALSENSKIRVLVAPAEGDNWPSPQFLRFGTRAKGWVLLQEVSLGFEIWRQLNGFPPEFSDQAKENLKTKWGMSK